MKKMINFKYILGSLAVVLCCSCSTGVERTATADDMPEQKIAKPQTNKQTDDNQSQAAKNNQSDPNRFNRILSKSRTKTSTLKEDGIYDPDNPSLGHLQNPSEAFRDFPESKIGNRVDWVKALHTGKITPRHDVSDPNIKPMVMDLNIIMQVKGSMPDVVFPHKKHTEWLDCSNCHPAIFIPQSGANKMSMADNLRGKKCGVCHGKVAFPLSGCTKCHSNKKVVVKQKK